MAKGSVQENSKIVKPIGPDSRLMAHFYLKLQALKTIRQQ